MFTFPIKFKFLKPVQHWVKSKIHRTHISEATSGLNFAAGSTRSSTVMYGLPPVVILITEFVPCFMRGKKGAKPSGD